MAHDEAPDGVAIGWTERSVGVGTSTFDRLREMFPADAGEEARASLAGPRLGEASAAALAWEAAAASGSLAEWIGARHGQGLAAAVREAALGKESVASMSELAREAACGRTLIADAALEQTRAVREAQADRVWSSAGRPAERLFPFGAGVSEAEAGLALNAASVSAYCQPPPRPLYDMPLLPEPPPPPARSMYERLAREIIEFEAGLSVDDDLGGRLVAAPGEGVFHVENLGYRPPDVIVFTGKNADGRPVRLVLHYSQASITPTALPKEKEQPRRIGFDLGRRVGRGGPR